MNTVVIMRGPTGSGKSTYVRQYFRNACVVSADNFFMKTEIIRQHGDGGPTRKREHYDFDPRLLPQAHAACLRSFVDALAEGVKTVVVDNTNIHLWELGGYLKIAKLAKYEVEIVQFVPTTIEDIKTCLKRNTHGVPFEIVAKMCVEFEKSEAINQKGLAIKTLQISEG